MTQQAYQLLASYWQRARDNAKSLPSQQEIKRYLKGIGFLLAGHNCVSMMGNVHEILNLPAFTRIPRVKPWVLGVANIRGRLVPVVDLPMYLQLPSSQPFQKRRLLVVEDQHFPVGLLVDDLLGMQQLPEEDLVPWQANMPELSPYVEHCFKGKQGWLMFDIKALVSAEAFKQVAVQPEL